MEYKSEYNLPWRIVFRGHFVRGYASREEAETSAAERNARAEKMGLPAEYKVVNVNKEE